MGIQKPFPLECEPHCDELQPIAEMMSTLFLKANESVPLSHKKVYLAIPDFDDTSYTITWAIRGLFQLAGLDGFDYPQHQRQSQVSMSELYNLQNCYGIWIDILTQVPDEECEKYQGRPIQSVLFIHLDESSLNFRSMIRDDGTFDFEPGSLQLLWADEEARQGNIINWDWVERSLRKFLDDRGVTYDLLLLSGTQATTPEFQQIIRDMFHDNKKLIPQDFLRGADDHSFAAARGAAHLARVGNCGGFRGCVSNEWCPLSERCREWAWQFQKGKEDKTEL